MAARGGRVGRLLARDRLTQGIEVEHTDGGVAIDLHVVVEYGLNLAEVAATVRSRVAYEIERLTGLRVARVEVHIEDVRRSGCATTSTSSGRWPEVRSRRSRRAAGESTT